jgi:hypothetical protein
MQYNTRINRHQLVAQFIHEDGGLCEVRELVATLDVFGRFVNIQVEGMKLKEATELRYGAATDTIQEHGYSLCVGIHKCSHLRVIWHCVHLR